MTDSCDRSNRSGSAAPATATATRSRSVNRADADNVPTAVRTDASTSGAATYGHGSVSSPAHSSSAMDSRVYHRARWSTFLPRK